MCVCVRACVCMCVRECVCVCLLCEECIRVCIYPRFFLGYTALRGENSAAGQAR